MSGKRNSNAIAVLYVGCTQRTNVTLTHVDDGINCVASMPAHFMPQAQRILEYLYEIVCLQIFHISRLSCENPIQHGFPNDPLRLPLDPCDISIDPAQFV